MVRIILLLAEKVTKKGKRVRFSLGLNPFFLLLPFLKRSFIVAVLFFVVRFALVLRLCLWMPVSKGVDVTSCSSSSLDFPSET